MRDLIYRKTQEPDPSAGLATTWIGIPPASSRAVFPSRMKVDGHPGLSPIHLTRPSWSQR
ncbi:hypothetical protein BO78DRAFT_169142 [Aspergillus sclerotiicarbonarius CBS 121057]|uniref:Uncharacterized protein n=1 Tax=Aspergillus sclerotiicarbonarius (strain CBS 121057 / IBT 28362) TaxID=1448318 RepID=A0A319EDJ3_ASPSB|nr:hypothetical protein BO78DRAFT_169142 [Aspergillus sclerotiicarbonarius CBS 121057]